MSTKRKDTFKTTYGKHPNKRRLPPGVVPAEFIDLTDDTNMSFGQNNNSSDPLRASRPTSQKAATMAAQPTEENIQAVCAFTDCDATTAARYLKVSCSRSLSWTVRDKPSIG